MFTVVNHHHYHYRHRHTAQPAKTGRQSASLMDLAASWYTGHESIGSYVRVRPMKTERISYPQFIWIETWHFLIRAKLTNIKVFFFGSFYQLINIRKETTAYLISEYLMIACAWNLSCTLSIDFDFQNVPFLNYLILDMYVVLWYLN